jgi:acyl carrier protein
MWVASRAVPGDLADRESVIRTFLADNFPLGGDVGTLGAETSLLEAGVIDSTGVLELIGFLEDTFGVAIPDDDLVPANFDTIGSIVRYLERSVGA